MGGGNCPPSPTPLITGVTPIVTEVVTIASIHIAVQSDGSIQHCINTHEYRAKSLQDLTPKLLFATQIIDEGWQCQTTNY